MLHIIIVNECDSFHHHGYDQQVLHEFPDAHQHDFCH